MHPPVRRPAAAALFDYHSPFGIDFGRVVCHEVRIVMDNHQAGVDNALTHDRNIVKHICGLLDSGGCVDVVAEIRPYALEIVQQSLSREILGTVEAHVLEEVRETVLVRGFLDCTNMRCQIEFSPLCRLVIMFDVISQTIVELAYADSGVVRQQLLGIRGKREGHGKNCGQC